MLRKQLPTPRLARSHSLLSSYAMAAEAKLVYLLVLAPND
jgi:hypothetical protein